MQNEVRYLDDSEQGVARETSHPRFVALALDDFYYDVGDDFSPFGSDDGNDTLSALEDWYRESANDDGIVKFLEDFLAGWGLAVPWDRVRNDLDARKLWLSEDDMHEVYFRSDCRAIVATAFGQLKIVGHINADLLQRAMAAIADQLWMNAYARVKYPQWPYAEQEAERLQQMQSVLGQVSNA